jgi:aspartate 1-decarboxylase
MKEFFASKIRNIQVTQTQLQYDGSVLVDRRLMEIAGIPPFVQVWVSNLSTGVRWLTYAIPHSQPGMFSLNGGEARYGQVGDDCVLIMYEQAEQFNGATVVFCQGRENYIKEVGLYSPDGTYNLVSPSIPPTP